MGTWVELGDLLAIPILQPAGEGLQETREPVRMTCARTDYRECCDFTKEGTQLSERPVRASGLCIGWVAGESTCNTIANRN